MNAIAQAPQAPIFWHSKAWHEPCVAFLVCMALGFAPWVHAQSSTQAFVLISRNEQSGTQPTTEMAIPSGISDDGNVVLFRAGAGLIPGIAAVDNLYLKSVASQQLIHVARRPDGQLLSSDQQFGNRIFSLDRSGRYVVFRSSPPSLQVGDTVTSANIYRFDAQTLTTQRVSVAPENLNGNFGNAGSSSSNGRFVTYTSNGAERALIYLRDLDSGLLEEVTVNDSGQGVQFNWMTFVPRISNDGRYVLMAGASTDLAPGGFGNTIGGKGVFLRDRAARTTRKILAENGRELFDVPFTSLGLSGDGTLAVFAMEGYFIEPCSDPLFGGYAIVALHIPSWKRECVMLNDRGEPANGDFGDRFSVSDDGNRIVFSTNSNNLGNGPPPDLFGGGIYLRDRALKRTIRMDVRNDNVGANGPSRSPVISPNGEWVAFSTRANNLGPVDNNGTGWDVYRVNVNQAIARASVEPIPVNGLNRGLSTFLALLVATVAISHLARKR